MTIHLPKELEDSIQAAVDKGQFASVDAAMAEAAALLVERIEQANNTQPAATQPPAASHRPIWEEFQEIASSVPSEEWAKLPKDGAEQHDHYIHGTPKRPSA